MFNQNLYLIKTSHSIQNLPLDRVHVSLTILPLGRQAKLSPLLENKILWEIPLKVKLVY